MINGRRRKYYIKDNEKFNNFIDILLIFILVLGIGIALIGSIILEKQSEHIDRHHGMLIEDVYPDISELRAQTLYIDANVKRLENDLEEIKNLSNFPSFDAECSWYTAGYESTGKTPDHPEYGLTASGKMVQATHTIAADERFPFGTKILIDDIVYVVDDRGPAIYDNRIDIFVENLSDIPPEGRVIKKAYILEWGGK
jgi:3D (Asp-Asp-Asp) domain-containing protein